MNLSCTKTIMPQSEKMLTRFVEPHETTLYMFQVLGRDILKSSLLDDIDLYLECDDDSLYVMPTVMSPTHNIGKHNICSNSH